jgi:hypothetical protein
MLSISCLYFLLMSLSIHVMLRAAALTAPDHNPSLEFNPSPIYYLSTNEGLISHFRQLEILWNFAESVNRSIVAVKFYSHHYRHVPVSICDIFVLPSSISCSMADNRTIIEEKQCVFTGILSTSMRYYGVSLAIDSNISMAKQECIAGFISQAIGYPVYQQRMKLLNYPFFTDKYRRFLPIIYKTLGLTGSSEYAVAHWRRGDQVTKCTDNLGADGKPLRVKRVRRRIDNSVNCGNASEFLQRFYGDIDTYVATPPEELLLVVCTNERNDTHLEYLRSHGVVLFDVIHDGLAALGYELNDLDQFVVELMVMCDATYLFAWGDSSSHNFFHYCRIFDQSKKHVTVIDDPHSVGHGYHVNEFTSTTYM